jgi:hypothetical protein
MNKMIVHLPGELDNWKEEGEDLQNLTVSAAYF